MVRRKADVGKIQQVIQKHEEETDQSSETKHFDDQIESAKPEPYCPSRDVLVFIPTTIPLLAFIPNIRIVTELVSKRFQSL